MRVLIISGTCSAQKYENIYNTRTGPMLDSNQKFFLSLIDGMKTAEDVFIDCVTALPISYRCYKKRIVRQQDESVDRVFFHYCGCINLPIIRTLTVGYNIRRFVKAYLKKHANEKIIVLCDGLMSEANVLTPLLKRNKVPAVALVTDVPHIVSDLSRGQGFRSWISQVYGNYATKMLTTFDGYIFLTEQMKDVCNPKGKPFTIMECIVTPLDPDSIPEQTLSNLPVVLYAGKLHSDFGVLQLAESAKFLEGICEVWLYGGQGDCDEQLQELSKRYSNLKLHGIVTLKEIHQIERNADILINPRPNEKAFTKYSFPSKTAEYLMMRVPVVMHRLDGIPHEYDKYLYYIEENTAESIADKLRDLLSVPKEKRTELARIGHEFIVQNKNNVSQAHRMLEFLKEIKSEE